MSYFKQLTSLKIYLDPFPHNRAAFPNLLPALGAAGIIKELYLDWWDINISRFQRLTFSSLTKLTLTSLSSLACYEELARAKMPALESLEISEDHGIHGLHLRFPDDLSTSLVEHVTSPFPNLRSLTAGEDGDALSLAAIKFMIPLLPGLKELVLGRTHDNCFEKLFGEQIATNISSSSSFPVWPNLTSIQIRSYLSDRKINGYVKSKDIEILKLLPAQCPSLKYLIMSGSRYPEGHDVEIINSLKDAARQGIWSTLRSVMIQYRPIGEKYLTTKSARRMAGQEYTESKRVHIWPIEEDNSMH